MNYLPIICLLIIICAVLLVAIYKLNKKANRIFSTTKKADTIILEFPTILDSHDVKVEKYIKYLKLNIQFGQDAYIRNIHRDLLKKVLRVSNNPYHKPKENVEFSGVCVGCVTPKINGQKACLTCERAMGDGFPDLKQYN